VVYGEAPAGQTIWWILESKQQLWWQQVFLIFLRINVIFCTKQKNCSWVQFPMRSFFSWGICYNCPMEVGAYVCYSNALYPPVFCPAHSWHKRWNVAPWDG